MATSLEVVDKLAADCGGLHGSKYVPGVTQLKGWIGVKGSTQDPRGILSGCRVNCAAMYWRTPRTCDLLIESAKYPRCHRKGFPILRDDSDFASRTNALTVASGA